MGANLVSARPAVDRCRCWRFLHSDDLLLAGLLAALGQKGPFLDFIGDLHRLLLHRDDVELHSKLSIQLPPGDVLLEHCARRLGNADLLCDAANYLYD